jgi:hypothetical protein
MIAAIREWGRSKTSASIRCETPFRLAMKMTRLRRNFQRRPTLAFSGSVGLGSGGGMDSTRDRRTLLGIISPFRKKDALITLGWRDGLF